MRDDDDDDDNHHPPTASAIDVMNLIDLRLRVARPVRAEQRVLTINFNGGCCDHDYEQRSLRITRLLTDYQLGYVDLFDPRCVLLLLDVPRDQWQATIDALPVSVGIDSRDLELACVCLLPNNTKLPPSDPSIPLYVDEFGVGELCKQWPGLQADSIMRALCEAFLQKFHEEKNFQMPPRNAAHEHQRNIAMLRQTWQKRKKTQLNKPTT